MSSTAVRPGLDAPRVRFSQIVPLKQAGVLPHHGDLAAHVLEGDLAAADPVVQDVSPRAGSSKRQMRRSSELFPVPLCPTTAVSSPGSRTRLMSRSTGSSAV